MTASHALRCLSFMSAQRRPARWNTPPGRFDQRCFCAVSPCANCTVAFCAWSSVARKASAAATMRGVVVGAAFAAEATQQSARATTVPRMGELLFVSAEGGDYAGRQGLVAAIQRSPAEADLQREQHGRARDDRAEDAAPPPEICSSDEHGVDARVLPSRDQRAIREHDLGRDHRYERR